MRTAVEVVVSARLTEDEAVSLDAWATTKGLSRSAAVAECVRRVLRRSPSAALAAKKAEG